jgi:hypothetical protein
MFRFLYNLCMSNKIRILPTDEFDIAVERTVYNLLFTK